MIFTKTKDCVENQIYFRHISENGLIELGIYPTIFGYRVRSGFIAEKPEYNVLCIDWCGGSNYNDVSLLFNFAYKILSLRTSDKNAFKDIPVFSKVKPYIKDAEFLSTIIELAEESDVHHIKIPDLTEIRKSSIEYNISKFYDKK